MCDIVWVSLQGHRRTVCKSHFLLQAPQCPCSVQKWFNRGHCCWGRSKPGCRIVGSHTRWELTTWADFQLCLHRLLMSASPATAGKLRTSGWIGQLWCLTLFKQIWLYMDLYQIWYKGWSCECAVYFVDRYRVFNFVGVESACSHMNWRLLLTLSELPFRLWCLSSMINALLLQHFYWCPL